MSTADIAKTERAIQLVGPDQLALNEQKPVPHPGPHQILGKVEVVGLCFSDLKLLKQFDAHARKSAVAGGLPAPVLAEIPSYVPGQNPTVPGHETVVRIVAVGRRVQSVRLGGRYLVQTDYRWLPTTSSNAAFGYNFEGGLQEYVLMDERVITSPAGESMLIPVPEDLSASAIALIEPWACVEDAYVERQRQGLKPDGRLLLVADVPAGDENLQTLFRGYGRPGQVAWARSDELAGRPDAAYDDVVYFGARAETVEQLFPKIANAGLFNIVQCGQQFGKPVVAAIGRVHYGGIRLVGTAGFDPAESMNVIPSTVEVRAGDTINVIGAAGPMGMMHVIRDLSLGLHGITVYAGDLNEERLAGLRRVCEPVARQHHARLHPYHPQQQPLTQPCSYIVVMAPVPALVVQAVAGAAPRAIINIFAGIPANVTAAIDLDAYIAKQLYFVGTSGSTLEDMQAVLAKVVSRRLDTNLSVAAIAGLEGAIDGIRAVEKNLLPGKILVYPGAKGLKLTPLTELNQQHPAVSRALDDGRWTRDAEQTLVDEFHRG
ncbi:alcohol dehydrogenase catalytic domain-containing protein [bacterium]|nr:alcohol dehydrogenase catalytic domain-containing protein [bacterium]